jgi:hypothetical protein
MLDPFQGNPTTDKSLGCFFMRSNKCKLGGELSNLPD